MVSISTKFVGCLTVTIANWRKIADANARSDWSTTFALAINATTVAVANDVAIDDGNT